MRAREAFAASYPRLAREAFAAGAMRAREAFSASYPQIIRHERSAGWHERPRGFRRQGMRAMLAPRWRAKTPAER